MAQYGAYDDAPHDQWLNLTPFCLFITTNHSVTWCTLWAISTLMKEDWMVGDKMKINAFIHMKVIINACYHAHKHNYIACPQLGDASSTSFVVLA